MAIVAALFKQQLEAAILNGLNTQFSKDSGADPTTNQKMAAAISEIADVIVSMLTTQASVLPGIATAGSPAAQTSVSPGKIL